jgi:hypothetical protein
LAETLLFADAVGQRRSLTVAQLAEPGARGTEQWVGLPFDPAHPSPDSPVCSIVVDAPAGVNGMSPVAGLVVDEWTEVAPRRVERTLPDGQTVREAVVATGLAVNANAPNARPPQAILLAISADGQRWTTPALADTLGETLELAQLRLVTLERALWAGRILPALQEQSWSLQGEKTLDVKKIMSRLTEITMPYVKDLAP